jgi:RNA polymerase sigma-70 factor (ECF subfamily)
VSKSQSGFERLFNEHYTDVSRYVSRRIPTDGVHDVVSETFLTAWRRYGELRGDPLPWLLGVARRVTANHLRGDARRAALDARLGEAGRVPLASEMKGTSRLALALSTLSARDEEALMLIAWDGLEHRVAARVMGCSTAAFSVRLHRARRKLERALTCEEDGPINTTQPARTTQ